MCGFHTKVKLSTFICKEYTATVIQNDYNINSQNLSFLGQGLSILAFLDKFVHQFKWNKQWIWQISNKFSEHSKHYASFLINLKFLSNINFLQSIND